MGDQAEAGRMLKQMAAERRRNRLDLNWSVLDECGIPFEERASSVLFRDLSRNWSLACGWRYAHLPGWGAKVPGLVSGAVCRQGGRVWAVLTSMAL